VQFPVYKKSTLDRIGRGKHMDDDDWLKKIGRMNGELIGKR